MFLSEDSPPKASPNELSPNHIELAHAELGMVHPSFQNLNFVLAEKSMSLADKGPERVYQSLYFVNYGTKKETNINLIKISHYKIEKCINIGHSQQNPDCETLYRVSHPRFTTYKTKKKREREMGKGTHTLKGIQ